MRALAALTLCAVLHAYAPSAQACTPINYSTGLQPAAVADDMLDDAPTVELMRVVSREVVRAHPVYADIYSTPVYRFRFESVGVLKGRSRGVLELHGIGTDARFTGLPEVTIRQRSSLWWMGTSGYAGLQESVILDPEDTGSVACLVPLAFAVGSNYLVFRDENGALLHPGFLFPRRASWPSRPAPQRPVIEIVASDSDPWLLEVRSAILRRGEGPDSFWDGLFRIIFGNQN